MCLAATTLLGSGTGAAAAEQTLTLSARSDEIGRITLAARDPGGATVDVAERVGATAAPVRRITLAGGAGVLRRAASWRCDRRSRTFTATSTHADTTVQTATATIETPSCAHRLRMIVTPAQVRPGQAAAVRVSDRWHLGGLAARVCARTRAAVTSCRTVRPPARGNTRSRVRLGHAARWSISLRTTAGQALSRTVHVRPAARLRLLVSGDSLVYGIFEDLRSVLGARALVRGDPNPATGISKPIGLDWPAHVRTIAHSARPDVSVLFLGGSEGFALTPPGGVAVACCGPGWVAEYARRATGIIDSLLRDGRGLVYWVILPAPRSPAMATVFRAVNEAIRLAVAGFDDGARALDRIATIVAPNDRFRASITYKGKRRVVREPDGFHLAPAGVHIAMGTILQQLRRDGLL